MKPTELVIPNQVAEGEANLDGLSPCKAQTVMPDITQVFKNIGRISGAENTQNAQTYELELLKGRIERGEVPLLLRVFDDGTCVGIFIKPGSQGELFWRPGTVHGQHAIFQSWPWEKQETKK